jgi:hypothetical protein
MEKMRKIKLQLELIGQINNVRARENYDFMYVWE